MGSHDRDVHFECGGGVTLYKCQVHRQWALPLVPPFVGPALYLWPEQEARSRRSVAVPETLLVYPCTTGVLRPLP